MAAADQFIAYCIRCGNDKLIPMPILRENPPRDLRVERLYCSECQAQFKLEEVSWKRL